MEALPFTRVEIPEVSVTPAMSRYPLLADPDKLLGRIPDFVCELAVETPAQVV
jgi:hypothetical protein